MLTGTRRLCKPELGVRFPPPPLKSSRAATSIYIDLINLAHLRITIPAGGAERAFDAVERSIKDEIGRVLMAAIHVDIQSAFEQAAGVTYPSDHFGKVHLPFDRLLDWIVTGEAY